MKIFKDITVDNLECCRIKQKLSWTVAAFFEILSIFSNNWGSLSGGNATHTKDGIPVTHPKGALKPSAFSGRPFLLIEWKGGSFSIMKASF